MTRPRRSQRAFRAPVLASAGDNKLKELRAELAILITASKVSLSRSQTSSSSVVRVSQYAGILVPGNILFRMEYGHATGVLLWDWINSPFTEWRHDLNRNTGAQVQTSTALVAAHTSNQVIYPSAAATFPSPPRIPRASLSLAPNPILALALAHDHDGPQFREHTASGAWSETAPSSKPARESLKWGRSHGESGARDIPSRGKDADDSNLKWGEEHADSNPGSKPLSSKINLSNKYLTIVRELRVVKSHLITVEILGPGPSPGSRALKNSEPDLEPDLGPTLGRVGSGPRARAQGRARAQALTRNITRDRPVGVGSERLGPAPRLL
ncbi:hypothetical protein B0H16DRAFT_1807915 [Mycena metata]|uniref:Uncharacterized protein n=1 Tax=Mycena metata TaxID=1033252 RepID=A0AAD7MFQ1_9AGAR|nr:hypothetical protein B0H16DRAFT_1807915 [Mycena metata]